MKVFVTGATGFIGSYLIMELANKGVQVHAIYRSKTKIENLQHDNIKWFKGDIVDNDSLAAAMAGCEEVYHVAAYAMASEAQKGDFFKYNVEGTINVLNAAKNAGVKKVVVTSTAGVFGPSLNGVINETQISSLPHFTGYEKSKAEVEELILQRVKEGENIVIVNPTRVYGPGPLNDSNSVTKMIKLYCEGKWRILPGNGKTIGNYVFITDVVRGHILAMQYGRAGEKYILGGENVTYIHFFKTIQSVINKKYFLIPLPLTVMLLSAYIVVFFSKLLNKQAAFTPSHVRKFNYNWQVSNNKAVDELSYNITSLKDGITKTTQWVLS